MIDVIILISVSVLAKGVSSSGVASFTQVAKNFTMAEAEQAFPIGSRVEVKGKLLKVLGYKGDLVRMELPFAGEKLVRPEEILTEAEAAKKQAEINAMEEIASAIFCFLQLSDGVCAHILSIFVSSSFSIRGWELPSHSV